MGVYIIAAHMQILTAALPELLSTERTAEDGADQTPELSCPHGHRQKHTVSRTSCPTTCNHMSQLVQSLTGRPRVARHSKSGCDL